MEGPWSLPNGKRKIWYAACIAVMNPKGGVEQRHVAPIIAGQSSRDIKITWEGKIQCSVAFIYVKKMSTAMQIYLTHR